MMKPDGAGYRGIGPNAGKFVPADEALESALEQCGVSIIMVSSDMEEIMGMSDRILVMCEGRISGELHRGEYTQEKILEYAAEVSK